MDELTWPAFAEAMESGVPIMMPIGSIEQHGPHLPLATDAIIPHELAKRVAAGQRVLIAPPQYFATYSRPRTGGGRRFPGSVGFPGSVLTSVIAGVLEELVRDGARRFVVLNGHLENSTYVYDAVESVLGIDPAGSMGKALLINWWELVTPEDKEDLFPREHPAWGGDHASFAETSLMLALRPDLVLMDRAADATPFRPLRIDILPPPRDAAPENGILWRATLADLEVGKRLVQLLEARIGRAIIDEFGLEAAPRPARSG